MQRLYRVLLLLSVAAAAAVCLRPSVAEELLRLANPAGFDFQPAESWGESEASDLLADPRAAVPPSRQANPLRDPPEALPQPMHPSPRPAYVAGPHDGRADTRLPSEPRPADGWPAQEGAPGLPYQGRERRTGISANVLPTDRWTLPVGPFGPSPIDPEATSGYAPPPAGTLPVGSAPPGRFEPCEGQSASRPPQDAVPCESAEILARVGSEVVLASEVNAAVNEILAQHQGKIPVDQMEAQRRVLLKKLLEQRIEVKLIYQDACRAIPKENLDKFKDRLGEQFESMEIPRRMKLAQVTSRRELDEKMRALGTSLEREKKAYLERVIAQQWLHQQAKVEGEISHEEMLAYYYEHLAEFERPARARWEQLTVRKAKFPSEAEARAALARMGNLVLDGAPLAEVAKAQSHGPTASQGGFRDWTTQGSLLSTTLDQALFGLPVGQLSQILEDDREFHIIRVVERQDAARVPFTEAQVEIREKINDQRQKTAREAYLARIKQQIPVWTVFDNASGRNEEATFLPRLER